jgi:hypothetical protein
VLCPACQQECSSETVCPRCGVSLLNAGAQAKPGDTFTATANDSATDRLKSIFVIGAAAAAWVLVVFLAYVRTKKWSGGAFNAESFGYFIGSGLTPVLVVAFVVWLVDRSRKDKMSAAHKQLWMASLALGISLVSFAGSLRLATGFDKSAANKQAGHLMKQAAGKEAVTADSEWYDGPTRQFFRDILAFNQEYTSAVHAIDQSSLPKLYTPESYGTRAGMQNTITVLHALVGVDKKYESLEPVLKKMEANIYASSASDYEKEEFLKGFRGSTDKSLAPRRETFRAEEEWMQSSIELYEFTLAHFGDYKVQGKKLMFRVNGSREQFQGLQSKSIALHKTAIESKHKFDAVRQDALSQSGVTPADLSSPGSKEK